MCCTQIEYLLQVPDRITPWRDYVTTTEPFAIKFATIFISPATPIRQLYILCIYGLMDI